MAISNHRLVSFENDHVTFRWRDSAQKNKQRLLTLHLNEFLRRFLLHVLPPGYVRIRHFGFLSTRNRSTLLPLCFRLLQDSGASTAAIPVAQSEEHVHRPGAVWLCPSCHGDMVIIERLTEFNLRYRPPPEPTTNAA